MSNFDRRLSVMQRRPVSAGVPTPDPATYGSSEGASSIGWQAAERISHLVGTEPGMVIKLVVEGSRDDAVLELRWDDDGIPLIRQL